MNAWTVTVEVGARLAHNGELWTVVAMEAGCVVLGDLDPEGIVRVNGENWSAVAVNGPVRAGTPVQVVRVAGVRLEVWGDETAAACGGNELDVAIPTEGIPTEGAPSSPAEATNEGGGS